MILEIGKTYTTESGRKIKVMAYADKYYMLRFSGCMPFVRRENMLEELKIKL